MIVVTGKQLEVVGVCGRINSVMKIVFKGGVEAWFNGVVDGDWGCSKGGGCSFPFTLYFF